MIVKRRSLAERDAGAITADLPTIPDAPAPIPAPAPRPATKAAPAKGDKPRGRAVKGPQTHAQVRVGSYLLPGEFDAARGAFLADWARGGTLDTFGAWVAAALEAHVARTVGERAALRTPRGNGEGLAAIRTFRIPADTVERLRAAIGADHAAGSWPSESSWVADALLAEAERARVEAGGHLPTPPPRLPMRLKRG